MPRTESVFPRDLDLARITDILKKMPDFRLNVTVNFTEDLTDVTRAAKRISASLRDLCAPAKTSSWSLSLGSSLGKHFKAGLPLPLEVFALSKQATVAVSVLKLKNILRAMIPIFLHNLYYAFQFCQKAVLRKPFRSQITVCIRLKEVETTFCCCACISFNLTIATADWLRSHWMWIHRSLSQTPSVKVWMVPRSLWSAPCTEDDTPQIAPHGEARHSLKPTLQHQAAEESGCQRMLYLATQEMLIAELGWVVTACCQRL